MHNKFQTLDFDKHYSLIVNDNCIYPGGSAANNAPSKDGFNCNRTLNSTT
jgi:hypothetical protein